MIKKNIIAIGGGKIMVDAIEDVETLTIDKAIVRAASKAQPKMLFIPTASSDDETYCQAITRLYNHLGCSVDHLLLYRDRPAPAKIRKLIRDANIIYVGGGNTLRMMKLWRRLGVDHLLKRAAETGTVMCGLSAGAICWFSHGNSDSRKFADNDNKTLIRVRALGLVDLLLCPHYDTERHRQKSLKHMMQKHSGISVALENNTAIQIRNEQYRIIQSQPRKQAWKIFWHNRAYHKLPLTEHNNFRSMKPLLRLHVD